MADNPTIGSPEEAQSLARLIQQGRITGDARDTAMQALRNFDASYKGAAPGAGAQAATPERAVTDALGRFRASDFLTELPETAAHVASGTLATIGGGLAGLADIPLYASGVSRTSPADVVQKVEQAGTYQPRTAGGQLGSAVVGYLPAKLAQGANYVGNKVQDATGSPLLASAADTAIQALPLALGMRLPALRGAAVESDAPQAAAAAARPISPEVAQATGAGLRLTPEQGGGGLAARIVQSLTGSAKLERAVSKANAPTVNGLAKAEIGVPSSQPLNARTLAQAAAPANAVYREVSQLGQIPTSDAYRADIARIANPGAGSFGFDVPQQVADLKQGYGGIQSFDAGDAVFKIRQLRRDASRNLAASRYNPQAAALGDAQKAVADALENQIDRHLQNVAAGRAPATVELPAPQPTVAPLPKRNMLEPDATEDSVLQFLAKHPRGIDSAEAAAQGIDPADFRTAAANVGIRRAFRKGGMSFDEAAQALDEAGFPVSDEHGYSPNVLLDAIQDELRGNPTYSVENTRNLLEHEADTAERPTEPATPAVPDLMELSTAAMKAAPERAQAILDSWTDDRPETVARVQQQLQDTIDSARPAAPRNDLIDRYRAARVRLAKIANVRQAMRGPNVSASALLRQRNRGVPLSGNLRTIANAYEHFSRALQDPSKIRDGGHLSAMDLLAGAAGITHPPLVASILARPLARGFLASPAYQRLGIQRAPLLRSRLPATRLPSSPGLLGAARAAPFVGTQQRALATPIALRALLGGSLTAQGSQR